MRKRRQVIIGCAPVTNWLAVCRVVLRMSSFYVVVDMTFDVAVSPVNLKECVSITHCIEIVCSCAGVSTASIGVCEASQYHQPPVGAWSLPSGA